MKKLLFLLPFAGLCADVKLAWDASPSWANGPLTYVVYGDTNSGSVVLRQPVGTNLTALVTNLSLTKWYFVVTARSTNGVESDPSNTVLWDGTKPNPPSNLAVQYSTNLTDWTTLGFFRLQIK